jgi:AAA family ATP:ADP antiporter
MLLSPLLFERLGWRGVANATPKILLYGGSAFFVACITYQVGASPCQRTAQHSTARHGRAQFVRIFGGQVM